MEKFHLVQIPTAMPGGVQIAGTNRSGTKRRRAVSENSTADGPEAGRNLVERPLDQQQAGSVDLNREQVEMETHTEGDGDVVIEEGAGRTRTGRWFTSTLPTLIQLGCRGL